MGRLGGLLGHLGPYWGHLGAALGRLEAIRSRLDAFLDLRRPKMSKLLIFHRFVYVFGTLDRRFELYRIVTTKVCEQNGTFLMAIV